MKNYRMLVVGLLIGLATGVTIGGAAVYSQGKGGPGRQIINLPNRAVTAPFSDGVKVGNTLYLAGRLGIDPKTNKVPEDPEQEARLMIDGIKSVLTEAGMTMDDLVSVQIFCSDVALFDKFNPIYRSYFNKNLPARAFIGSGTLLRGARFEMQAIAVKQ
ncbi:MAG: RidA family protein [Blastocatellia bacterium]|nr:RidA family protein [Blastocatellia bacterium]